MDAIQHVCSMYDYCYLIAININIAIAVLLLLLLSSLLLRLSLLLSLCYLNEVYFDLNKVNTTTVLTFKHVFVVLQCQRINILCSWCQIQLLQQ